jgi:GntR family transcriptional regulator
MNAQPLYRRVKAALTRRIADGEWQPGQLIPSEFDIAREIGVSQGTVRKALDVMAAENLLVRRQGKGTFVARHDEARILFQFFKLVPDDGAKVFPESDVLSVGTARADAEAAQRLGLNVRARIVRIRRMRSMTGVPAIVETIVLPEAMFPGLARSTVPNNLYGLYADRYGVTVVHASERLKAVTAGPEDARLLGVPNRTPLLLIDRLAEAIDGTRAEWRVSLCRTDVFHYLSDLR